MTSPMPSKLPPTFASALERGGVEGALRVFAELTGYRYVAVFRFDGNTLRTMSLVDRDDASAALLPDIPVSDSYCTYVRDAGALFATCDAPQDPRTAGHAKRETIRAYVGAPIYDADGAMYGTICCFNVEPRPDDPALAEMLLEAAQLLTGELKRA